MRVMHVMGGGDVGGAKTQIMNTVTGLSRTNDVMLISFRAGPFADEARERGIDVRVIERHNPFRAAAGAKTPLIFAVYLSLSKVFSSSIKVLISLN